VKNDPIIASPDLYNNGVKKGKKHYSRHYSSEIKETNAIQGIEEG